MTDEQIYRWDKGWRQLPLVSALEGAAFTDGATKKRLDQLIPPGVQRINLLPPHPRAGAWDARLAVRVAALVAVKGGFNRIILLGRRVTDAFFTRTPLGVSFLSGGVSYLTLPHPSGRCRAYNDPAERERYRTMVEAFLR